MDSPAKLLPCSLPQRPSPGQDQGRTAPGVSSARAELPPGRPLGGGCRPSASSILASLDGLELLLLSRHVGDAGANVVDAGGHSIHLGRREEFVPASGKSREYVAQKKGEIPLRNH